MTMLLSDFARQLRTALVEFENDQRYKHTETPALVPIEREEREWWALALDHLNRRAVKR